MPSPLPPPPPASSAAARAVMRGNKGKDTSPELAVRRELHVRGLRYRVHSAPLAGLRCAADVVFPTEKVAVFVDGCWWHGCPEHGELPRANRDWWQEKIERTKMRDRRNDRELASAGWLVVRVWEHEGHVEAADRIARLVRSRRGIKADGAKG